METMLEMARLEALINLLLRRRAAGAPLSRALQVLAQVYGEMIYRRQTVVALAALPIRARRVLRVVMAGERGERQ